ncbi:hypothetical protein, partial [Pseudosulfitobacter pseudonitzschiae]
LETITSGAVFELLNEVRIKDAILAAQDVIAGGHSVVEQEQSDNAFAAIISEQEARVTADEAYAATFDGLLTELGNDVSAAIVAEQTARSTTDAALASAATALTARVGTAEGNISNIQATKVDATGAVSAVEQTISAKYGSLTAMANATAFAEATVEGIESGYVWQLNGSNILELVSVQDGVGSTPVSTARIDSDYVQITGKAQINQAVINLLAADAGFISNLMVDTLQIAGNAVTVPVINYGSGTKVGNGAWQSLAFLIVDMPVAGQNVALLWNISQGYTSGTPTWGFRLRKEAPGVAISTLYSREGMTFGNDYPSGTILATGLPAGPNYFHLEWKGQNSGIQAEAVVTGIGVAR